MITNIILALDIVGLIVVSYLFGKNVGYNTGFKLGVKKTLDRVSTDPEFVKLAIRRIKVNQINDFINSAVKNVMSGKNGKDEITIIRYDKGVK